MKNTYYINIVHETHGKILSESFVDTEQFRIFLKLVDACFAHQSALEFYNGDTFFIRIPYKILDECIITTKCEVLDMTETTLTERIKSKIEALKTIEVDGPPSSEEVSTARRTNRRKS
jgi:hypothetical protein